MAATHINKGTMFLGVAENGVKFCCLPGICSVVGRSEISTDNSDKAENEQII